MDTLRPRNGIDWTQTAITLFTNILISALLLYIRAHHCIFTASLLYIYLCAGHFLCTDRRIGTRMGRTREKKTARERDNREKELD